MSQFCPVHPFSLKSQLKYWVYTYRDIKTNKIPFRHVHEYPPIADVCKHSPPFWQGFEAHELTLTSQLIPFKKENK